MKPIDQCFEQYDALNMRHTELRSELADCDANLIKLMAEAFMVDQDAYVRFDRLQNGAMPRWGAYCTDELDTVTKSPKVNSDHIAVLYDLRFLDRTDFKSNTGLVTSVEFRLNPDPAAVLQGYRTIAEL